MPWNPFGADSPEQIPRPDPEPEEEADCCDEGSSFIKPFSEWFKPDPPEPKSEESRRTRYGTSPDSGYSEGSPESRG
jgi:hypothetical protein